MKMEPVPLTARRSFYFSAVLSAIVLVANVAGQFLTGDTGVGMTTLICFLPMAFWFADASQQRTRQYVEALESRIRQLEAGEGAA